MMHPAGAMVPLSMAPPPQMDPQQMAAPPPPQQYQHPPPQQYQQAPPQYQQPPPPQYQQGPPPPQAWGMMPPPMMPQPQYLQAPQPPSMWGQQPSQIPPPVPMQPQPLQPQPGYAQYPASMQGQAPSSADEIRTLWIGEVPYYMDESHIANLFGQFGEILSVKLIRNKQTQQLEGYGFIEFANRATAEQVLLAYNGQPIPGADHTFRLNWASKTAGERRTDDGADYTIFVGDLSSDVTDILLLETFKVRYSSIKGAKVVTDRVTGRSKGYGFVRFADPNEQTRAMSEMNGVYCSMRPMRIGAAATKKDMGAQQQYTNTRASYQNTQGAESESDPNNTTIFVGGLDPNVNEENLRQLFAQCGELIHVKIPVGKRCGFVQFASREKAEDALLTLNGTVLGAQSIRLSWGRSPAKQPQQDPTQLNGGGYYGYGQGYEAYGYAQPPQDPNMYAYGAYQGYGNYQQQQEMKRFFSVIGSSQNVASGSNPDPISGTNLSSVDPPRMVNQSSADVEVGFEDLIADPGLRRNIFDYDVKDRERVRRAYLQKGPCQPRNHTFPVTVFGTQSRRFVPGWFNEHSSWLEYSISKDAAFCLPCYLFKPDHGNQGGGDSFVGAGFKNWRKKDRFGLHVGAHNSFHNKCVHACEDLMLQKQHIEVCLASHSEQTREDYRVRLIASIDCIRYLLLQGLAFRGHDESDESCNRGNFLELLHFLSDHNDDVKRVTLGNAPENLKLTSPMIQKDIINAIAVETTNAIIRDMGDNLFSILVDEARDISVKEQMAVVLRFVDDSGCVLERFLGIVHVADTSALSLKKNIEALFSQLSSLRGQGYDGASNMRGEFNGLKSLIMMDNQSAHYIHCFAHQLQLALVVVAQELTKIEKFFYDISMLSNIVNASCKRKEMLRTKSFEQVVEGLRECDILSGRGQNQEVSLGRGGRIRWNSHYRILVNLIVLYDPIIDVLIAIQNDSDLSQRAQVGNLLDSMMSFEFVFCLFLMKNVLGVSNELSQALQKKDQDIVNAMSLVKVSKLLLEQMRDGGWELLWEKVVSFCIKHNIDVPKMEDFHVIPGRARRNLQQITNYYRAGLFYEVIDMQLSELNRRFTEVNTELLLCMSCLDPSGAFSAFDSGKLIRFAELYPDDYSAADILTLEQQLDCYIVDVRSDDRFVNLNGIGELSRKLVQTKKHRIYHLVYLLVRLALLLPVATATVERAFSAMKLVKTSLRNRLGDELMNDCLVTYIEKDVVKCIETEDIIVRFQGMANRRMSL